MSETTKHYICENCGTEFDDPSLQKKDVLKIFQYKSIAGYLILLLVGCYFLVVFDWMSGSVFLWILIIVLLVDGFRAFRRGLMLSKAYREGRCPSCWKADYKLKL